MTRANQLIDFIDIESNRWTYQSAEIIVEMPVSLTVNGEIWLTFMCTPIHLEELAVGFLFNEGIIQNSDEIADVRVCAAGDNVDVWLNHIVEKPNSWRRTSGCTGGITSVTVEAPKETIFMSKSSNGFGITPNLVGELISKLFASQYLYQKSGGVHTSALSDGKDIFIVAEDIGRHNTLDKIAGKCLLENIQPNDHRIILTTGRISSEMLQKANRMGASILISRTSPSSLSIQLATNFGITLIGYARRDRLKVYAHPERILPIPKVNQEDESYVGVLKPKPG